MPAWSPGSTYITEGGGDPARLVRRQVARLDNVQGDIDTLADRIAGVRTWAYIAHRSDWLEDPEAMAERTREVEERLSDALHERLTQRFVDRRTAVLVRDIGRKGAGEFPVIVDEQGEVTVGSFPIGRMEGFAFEVDPAARHADRKMLLATAERRLGGEYEKRAGALVADSDPHFTLRTEPGQPVAVLWRGHEVARLGPGKNLLSPRILVDRRLDRLSERGRDAVVERLNLWVRHQVEKALAPLRKAGQAAQEASTPAPVRATLALLVDEGGIVPREAVAKALASVPREQRRLITALGVRIGALDLFMPDVLKPEARRWRSGAARRRRRRADAGASAGSRGGRPRSARRRARPLQRLGFRPLGPQMLRVDLVERLARYAHQARAAEGRPVVDQALATSVGLQPQAVAKLMRDLGFRLGEGEGADWVWRGPNRPRRRDAQAPDPSHAFAALAGLRRG
jgi:ATP-dependent RNA helicase SUPV3L1/SUV3